MANRIQFRRDTSTNWIRVNPVLEDGEPGLDITTNQIKYGDGSSTWTELEYASLGDSLVNGEYTVSLGADGNLTLPSGGYINYANGTSILNGITASGSTYSNANVASYLVTNPQAGTYSNANVASYLPTYSGNIAGNIVKGGQTWTFGTDGTTSFPSDTIKAPAGSFVQLSDYAGNNFVTVTDEAVSISTQLTSEYNWTFSNTGVLTFPTGTLSIGSYAGDLIQSTNNLNITGQVVTISAAANGSNLSQINMDGYGNVNIRSISNNGSEKNWNFGSDSNLTVPGNIQASSDLSITVPSGIPSGVANWEGSGGWNQSYYDNISTTGGTGTGLTVDVAAGGAGYIDINAISINTPGTGYTDGDVITIDNENNLPGTFTITVSSPSWTFGGDGGLTFPDDTVQTTAWTGILPNPTYSGSDEIGEATPAPLNLNNSAAATLLTQLNLINTGGGAGSGSAIDFWTYTSINDVPEVRLQAVDDGDYSADFAIKIKAKGESGEGSLTTSWTFGADGTTTFPDHKAVTMTGNLTVGNLTVNGNITYINTNSYVVSDNIVQFADGNPADTLDLGFVAHRTVGGTLEHTGLIRDASADNWKLFSNVTAQPSSTVDFTGVVYDDLQLGTLYSNLVSTTNLHIEGTAPSTNLGSAGDLAGDIRVDEDYVYYCTANWAASSYTVGWEGSTGSTLFLTKGSYPTPQAGWTVTYQSFGPYTIQTVTDNGTNWQITFDGTLGTPGGGTATLTNPTQPVIWKSIPLTAFGNLAYTNANVASYLTTYTGNIGNVKTTANVITTGYFVGNGALLTGIVASGSTYSNANVASYLPTYSGNVSAANFIGGGSAITSLSGAAVLGNVAEASVAYSVNISPVILNQEYHMAILPAKEGQYGVKAADGTANVTYNPVSNRLTIANIAATNITVSNVTVGNVSTSGNVTAAYFVTTGGYGNISQVDTITANTGIYSGNLTANGIAGFYAPNRPGFRVTGTGGQIAAVTQVTGASLVVDFNQGSYLNTTTGYFTAPVAGLYQVNLVVRTYTNTGVSAQAVVEKNDSTVIIMVEWAANTTMNHAGGSTVIKLAVGDTLRFRVLLGSISFDGNDNWSVAYLG